jgi:hypothetical protein
MRKLVFLLILFPVLAFGQSLFSNAITLANPSGTNPFVLNQVVNANIWASGIGRGGGLLPVSAKNRYNAKSWNSSVLDQTDYFEFQIKPNAGKRIDFMSFVYTGRVSSTGPVSFAFRSSVDGYGANIGKVTATGSTVLLSAAAFQNITTPIVFRIYAWGAPTAGGTFSVNDFDFKGTVGCAIPVVPHLNDGTTTCAATSFTVNWNACLNATDYSLDVATDAGFVNFVLGYKNKLLGNVISQIVSGLLAGKTYYVRLRSKNNCGISAYSNTAQFSPATTTYSSVSWSNGMPDINKKIFFASNYTMAADIVACSCKINTGVSVGVNSGVVLKLENELDVTGVLTFENNASLVQVNDALNTGDIVYKRIAAPMKNFDFTYWSSPVAGQVLNVLSPNTLSDKYFSFSNNDWVIETPTNTMNFGKGYIIRVPKTNFWPDLTAASYAQPVQFKGVPNNGAKTLSIGATDGDANLIGNPYPSAMSADGFLVANNKELDGTIYFWTHNTPVTNLEYSSSDYAAYNGVGGVNASAAASGGVAPNGYIAAGQSFFALTRKALVGATGYVSFSNSMRIAVANSNSQFFRGVKSKVATIEKHRVWLNLTNDKGAFKQTLVGYVIGATHGDDSAFDGQSFDGNDFIDFYSVNENKNLVIQGRALPFDKTDKVLLGYKTNVEETFAISIDKVDGVLLNQAVFIEDKVANVIHNLKQSPYTFSTLKGVFNDRFVLRYTDNSVHVADRMVALPVVLESISERSTLAVDDFKIKDKSVMVSVKEHQIKINSFKETVAKVMVYDLSGRVLYQNLEVNKNEFVIPNRDSTNQIVIVVTVLKNGTTQSDQIIF